LLADPNNPDDLKLTDHLLITIEEQTPCTDPAHIHVIPLDDYIRVNPAVEQAVADFRDFLSLRPAAIPPAERILDLPRSNAAQAMKTAISYLDFHNGSGARALILYTQNLTFASGCSFDYVFHGLTHDGRYLLTARIPIYIPVLDQNSVQGKYLFNERNYYVQYIQALVGGQIAESFNPDLSILDEMMRSFLIE
jgi:hypothetical protein